MAGVFERFLHRVYLQNYTLAQNSFELESILYNKAKQNKYSVLITGLARSGTTALLNNFHSTGLFASLSYRDMPFLLAPNIWGKREFFKVKMKNRLHDDNLLIGSESPEALDEFFWKVYLKPSYYSANTLPIQELDDWQVEKYKKYINLVCHAYSKEFFLSKNNNSVLRLRSIIEHNVFNKIFLLFRNPLDHASSLLKLHIKFSEVQKKDGYVLEYFNFLGHHEFGLNQKPFLLNPEAHERLKMFSKFELNYWLLIWFSYYKYISDNFLNALIFIDFDSFCLDSKAVMDHLFSEIEISFSAALNKKYIPSKYESLNYDEKILNECLLVYDWLKSRLIE